MGRSLVSELRVGDLLPRVLEAARELTGARYAAIGVLDPDGRELEQFLYVGIDEETARQIGPLPRGRGVLGVLIEEPRPLRLADVGRHPRSYGFPVGHPPMRTFLGTPIRIRGGVYGNLYLCEKEGGAEFTEADEETVAILADWAAIAVDNERVYASERDRRDELERAIQGLEATIDITRAIGGETDLGRVLDLICKRSRALVDATTVLLMLADEPGGEQTVTALAGEGDRGLIGLRVPVGDHLGGAVLASRRTARLTELGLRPHPALVEALHPRAGLVTPLTYRGHALGLLCAFDPVGGGEFTARHERLLGGFADSAAIAVATAQEVAEQSLRRSIEASERERARWARELHDETLQDLAGLKMLLSGFAGRVDDPALHTALEQIDVSITGLRHLITELRPAALDEYGLAAAVEALVERTRATSGLAVEAEIALAYEGGLADTRPEPEIESTVYRVIQEALTNVMRHSGAESVRVALEEGETHIRIEIADDGHGIEEGVPVVGFGLRGMRERVALVGGTLEVRSPEDGGTVVSTRIPRRNRPAQGAAARAVP
ncbi:MAG TPA: GAF domain-containing sensor histidine kinase [Solirubrobacteraceae bacterium]|nr:GAF domain-containing sensor histidine kinase [Solirubrobacteraceae bacterium]